MRFAKMGDGDVERETVIRVLRACGVAVSQQVGIDLIILEKADNIEVHRLDLAVSRRMLQRFSRRFGVPIHYFYNPDHILPEKVTC